ETSRHQTRQSRTEGGTWYGVDNARCAIGPDEYVGNEEGLRGRIKRGGEVSNRRIVNGKRESGDGSRCTAAIRIAGYPECEGPEVARRPSKRPGWGAFRDQSNPGGDACAAYVDDVGRANARPIECE